MAKDTRLLSKIQRSYYTARNMNITFEPVPLPPSPTGTVQNSPYGRCTCTTLWNLGLRKSFIINYQQIYPLPWRETFFLLMLESKQICPVIQRETLSSGTIHFLNMFKKILWNYRIPSVLRDPQRIFSQQLGFEFKPTSWHSLVVIFTSLHQFPYLKLRIVLIPISQ